MSSLKLKVSRVRRLTADIAEFELVPSEGGTLPAFEAGAHIDVETPSGIRCYSLANDPTDRERYVIAVLREPHGEGGSQWMHETLREGYEIETREPRNNFPVIESAPQHILIAGGIGVTPILSMGYRLKELGANFTCHYCTKSPEQTAFLEETKAVFGDSLVFHHDGGDPSKGIKLDEVLAGVPSGAHLYLCGPGGLIKAARQAAEDAGWPTEAIHFELFSSAKTVDEKAEAGALENEAFEIELAKSGLTLGVPAHLSILEVLEENNIDCLHVCREGWCETCEQTLLSGEADHRDEVLSDEEKAENKRVFVCVSRARPGQKLVLDM